jgi:hypothetical protein
MRKLLASALLALALGACGDKESAKTPTPTTTPSPEATVAGADPLEGYSQGVKDYYAGADPEGAEEGSIEAVEVEYHQPPKPAEAGLGETITLTGSNIGVRMRVTVTEVKRVSSYQAVELEFESTGITNYDGELRMAALSYGDGEPRRRVEGAIAPCSKDFTSAVIFIPVGGKASGCLLFPASGSEKPDRLQLALEQVPLEAGGIWNLT